MSKIEWTGKTWNPIVGCTKVSAGCKNCYAERLHKRLGAMGQAKYSLPFRTVREWPASLDLPLKRKKPTTWFVNSMGDLFHEDVTDEYIASVFGVMAACPQHTFQVLTKRPARARRWFKWVSRLDCDDDTYRRGGPAAYDLCQIKAIQEGDHRDIPTGVAGPWPLPNVWLGVSAEDQATTDERIPFLLQCPAAVRFVSYEPALGPVDFHFDGAATWGRYEPVVARINWVIVGGESGPGARPFNIDWARSVVQQCRDANVACFVKQLGRLPFLMEPGWSHGITTDDEVASRWPCEDRKGGDMSEWPEDLRVREMPT